VNTTAVMSTDAKPKTPPPSDDVTTAAVDVIPDEVAGDVLAEDKYEEYNYDQDKYEVGGGSGKGRSKKESAQHTNHHDPGGHTRKTTQKLVNSHEKEKEKEKEKDHKKE